MPPPSRSSGRHVDPDRGSVSRTAQYVALFRAIESAAPARSRLFDDPYAVDFLDAALRQVVRAAGLPALRSAVTAYIDRRWPGPRASAVVRTKLIDDAVSQALAEGAEQMVILGAGFDTRAIRLPAAAGVPTFELDRPVTQEFKKARLRGRLGELPANVIYVPFDLEDDGVGAPLARAGLVPGRHTVFIWEGVLSYLTEEAVDATLGWITQAGAPGSRLAFTYVDVALVEGGGGEGQPPWSAAVANVGEPFRYGLDPARTPSFLSDRGLRLIWDVNTAEAIADVLGESSVREAPSFYRVALAEN